MNADGGNQSRFTTSGAQGIYPVWSPDGSRIAFTSDASGDAYSIYTINPDGTDLTRVTTGAGVFDLGPGYDIDPLSGKLSPKAHATVAAGSEPELGALTLGG